MVSHPGVRRKAAKVWWRHVSHCGGVRESCSGDSRGQQRQQPRQPRRSSENLHLRRVQAAHCWTLGLHWGKL